ncbi:DUF1344 domain-containing protein, partial [Rhizobiaceae sp. 2RAB30]
PLLTAIAVVTSVGAYAAETSGSIKSVNAKAHTVTLTNGNVYELPASYDMSKLKANEKVKLTYRDKSGKHMATAAVAQWSRVKQRTSSPRIREGTRALTPPSIAAHYGRWQQGFR